MEFRLTEEEIKFALAVEIFRKTGARIEPKDFNLRFIPRYDNHEHPVETAIIRVGTEE